MICANLRKSYEWSILQDDVTTQNARIFHL